MKHLFVSYDLALKLKEKGFDEPCFAYYDGNYYLKDELQGLAYIYSNSNSFIKNSEKYTAPLYQQVIDWFREKYGIEIWITSMGGNNCDKYYMPVIPYCYLDNATKEGREYYNSVPKSDWNKSTYYEALNKAIEEALKLI